MTTLAHLSDLHLLEHGVARRSGVARLRVTYVSFGRSLDPEPRRVRVPEARRAAVAAGTTDLLLTGDLTEDGVPEQFEVLAQLLAECAFAPEQITLVPANRGGYTGADAFERALCGPLAPWAETSRSGVAI